VDRDKLIKRLMTTFLEELQEHVAALNRDLLALEKGPSEGERAERLKTLLRTLHSLKGASRSVNVQPIESACHRVEELLSAARDGQKSLDPSLFPLLFATADAFEEAAMRLREQQDLTASPLATLLPQLQAIAGGLPRPHAAGSPPRAALAEPVTPRVEPPPPPRTLPEPAPTELPSEPAAVAATVRIPADKLDGFLARSGELLVAQLRLQARAEELARLGDDLRRLKQEWRVVEKALGKRLSAMEAEPLGTIARENGRSDVRPLPRRAQRTLGYTGDNLRHLERELDRLLGKLAGDGRVLKQAAEALDDQVRRVRMLPFAEVCQGLERVVRDLACAGGKEVDLVVEGGAVELDRSVLEGLRDPLLHLVRNAVDHGVEPAAERRAAGKRSRARVTVGAVLRGTQVEVTVADDGRGLDLDALRQQARKRNLPVPAEERDLAYLIFLPGLSTARIITDVSGRGVGLDVVKSRVEALHGTVDVSFGSSSGTRFTLAVPLTLTTLRALLVTAAGQTFAFVSTNVEKLIRVDPDRLRSVEGREMLSLGGAPLPVASLAELLGLRGAEPAHAASKPPALVVAAGDKRLAFVVDEFLAAQEIVIKNLGARIRRVRHISGATILPSGRIALVLNAAALVRSALARAPRQKVAAVPTPQAVEARKRILLVDDSLTTRSLEKSILELAGYEVTAAADGVAAWQLLQERGADLVVSDIDMPRMDGLALTQAIRGSSRFRELPVVLVTARESEHDKTRGIEVGADAYLVKSAFDQKNLLETLTQLL
jgi:two-component system chemotaxis sensor kinase CheA